MKSKDSEKAISGTIESACDKRQNPSIDLKVIVKSNSCQFSLHHKLMWSVKIFMQWNLISQTLDFFNHAIAGTKCGFLPPS